MPEKINVGDHVYVTHDSGEEKSPWDGWVEKLLFNKRGNYYENGYKYPAAYEVRSGNNGNLYEVPSKYVFLMQENEEKYKELKVISMLPKEQQEVIKLADALGIDPEKFRKKQQ